MKKLIFTFPAFLFILFAPGTALASDCNCTAPDQSCSGSISCPGSCSCTCLNHGRCCCECCNVCVPGPGSRVSADFNDVPLRDVLVWAQGILGSSGRLSYDDRAVSGKRVTVKVNGARMDELLNMIAAQSRVEIGLKSHYKLEPGERLSTTIRSVKLGRALASLSQMSGLQMTTDDPDAEVNVVAKDVTVEQLIDQIREQTKKKIDIGGPLQAEGYRVFPRDSTPPCSGATTPCKAAGPSASAGNKTQ